MHAIKTSDFTLEAIYVVDGDYIGIKLRMNQGVWYATWYGVLPNSITEMEFLINKDLLDILSSAILTVDDMAAEDDYKIYSIEEWIEAGMPLEL